MPENIADLEGQIASQQEIDAARDQER